MNSATPRSGGVTSFAGLSGKASTAQGGLNQDNSGTSTFTPAQGVFFDLVQTKTNYIEGILQNLSGAAAASTDFVVCNDLSTATTFYGNLGINSSGFTGSGSLNLANATYLTATSGELVMGTTTANGIRFVVNSGTTDLLSLATAAASKSAFQLGGTLFTGGTGTTTFPLALIQPSGATASTSWNTIGTILGINYPSGFTGDIIAIKPDGGSNQYTFSQGNLTISNRFQAQALYVNNGGGFYGIGNGILRFSDSTGGNNNACLQFNGTTSSFPAIKGNGAVLSIRLADDSGFAGIEFGRPKFAGANSTGAGSALLGANSPAATLTAPYTWATVTTSDGSTGYLPIWK
jgi:hypothetical protein